MAVTTHSYMKIRNGDTPVPLPEQVKVGDNISARWANSVRMALQRLRDRTPVVTGNGRVKRTIKPPLWVTLVQVMGDPVAYKVYAEYGHVVPRHNTTADTGAPVTITDLPTVDTQLTVVVNTKLWVKETISDVGKVTAAAFESGATWPDDTPPELRGGDNATGVTGYRHIRIAEIIEDPDSTATPASLKREQLHTGHIDHFQNELCENIDTTGAAIMKKWDAATGKWLFRTITAGAGITVTENADSIEIDADAAATGLWGTTSWATNDGLLTHTYENGILINVGVSGTDAGYSGAGTEADPYEAIITFTDT